MDFQAMLHASHTYGGPYKLLLIQFRVGQLIGAILALSCYAWLISALTLQHSPVAASPKAIAGLGSFLSAYVLALLATTWRYFGRAWFDSGNIAGDTLAVGGSIAVAVLTRGSTSNCDRGLFAAGSELHVSTSVHQEACKLQKVVFATGVCNSIMFSITCLLYLALAQRWLNKNVGRRESSESERKPADGDGVDADGSVIPVAT